MTAGSACDCTDFVHRYAAQVPANAGGPARAVNLGVGGQTSAELLSEIGSGGAMAQQVAAADVLLVTIGANDLVPLQDTWSSSGCAASCSSPAVQAVGRNITGIVDHAKALRGGRPIRILVTDYWNVFEDGDVASASHGSAYLAWSDALSRQLNASVCSAARGAGATCVDLYAPFKGDGSRNPTALLAGDGTTRTRRATTSSPRPCCVPPGSEPTPGHPRTGAPLSRRAARPARRGAPTAS